MTLQVGEVYSGFKLIKEKIIQELGGIAREFKHLKSGAKLIHILNQDDDKVFTITFKTPPEDNRGAAHIIEHAVCCSSKKYPLKDTFIELQKGSLCTALNACTYPDMTMYYCASKNEKDFKNLIEVYMDLVFQSLIDTKPNLFKQEGWHYELRCKKDVLEYNGVVYHEMTGEYDDPSTLLEHTIHKALFPNTVYCYDAGGIPQDIVELSYSECIDFYKKYYHPTNACFYLYGDSPVLEHLKFLDSQCLSHFDQKEIRAEITLQDSLETAAYSYERYPLTKLEDRSEQALLALSFVIGTSQDAELRLAFEILEQMLLKSSASPLVETLIVHKELGIGIAEAGYDVCRQQPIFSIVLKGTSAHKKEEFEQTVFEVLNQLVSDGIDYKLVEASINSIEFEQKEADAPFEPRGVIYSEKIQNSYLYGGEPFVHLMYENLFEKIKQKAQNGYFEELIKKYFLENTHRALVLLDPCELLEKARNKEKLKKLNDYKKSLSKKEIKALIKMNKELDEMQDIPNTKEALESLPTLALSDITKEADAFVFKEEVIQDVKVLFNPEPTKGIVYIHLLFDTTAISIEDIPYIGILANVLTYVGTKKYTYLELDHAINSHVGGLGCQINAYADIDHTDSYRPLFKITAKLLTEKLPQFISLMDDILNTTSFMEQSKIREILSAMKYEMQRSFSTSPEYSAIKRVYSYFSQAGMYEDLVAGISYYDFLSELHNSFDKNFSLLSVKLSEISQKIFNRINLEIGVTAESKDFKRVSISLERLINALKQEQLKRYEYTLVPTIKNEGYLTNSSLYTVVKGLHYKNAGYTYHGTLQVICNILESTYLWDKVRLQGGAYGCDMILGMDGNIALCSYCDPHLIETLATYDGIGSFLRNLRLDEKELHKYIIGTIGILDSPLSMEQRSERAFTSYLCGITQEALQKARDEILETTLEDIHRFAALFDELAKQNIQCVIGNFDQIRSNQSIFKSLRSLSY